MQTHLTLNDGNTIPLLGLGTWNLNKDKVADAVAAAVKAGYRHIDCASIYGNEREVGAALKDALGTSVQREEMFITSKLWNTDHHPDRVEAACRQTLADLGLEYLDLYLVHWGIAFQPGGDSEPLGPDGRVLTERVPLQATWQAMEQLVDKGLVRSIGVSNYTAPMLLDLLTYAHIKPAVDQIELHPYLPQTDLVEFCQALGVAVEAYSPLASAGPQTFDAPVIAELAAKYKKTTAQILLRWAVQRGTVPLPKSSHPERVVQNFDIFGFELADDEQAAITALDARRRFVDPYEWWGVPYFG